MAESGRPLAQRRAGGGGVIKWLLPLLEIRLTTADLALMDGHTLQRLFLALDRWSRMARRELDLRAGIAYSPEERP